MAKTNFGVGASALKKNVGPTSGTKSTLASNGKVTSGSTVIFDPTLDKVKLQAADGPVPGDKPVDGE